MWSHAMLNHWHMWDQSEQRLRIESSTELVEIIPHTNLKKWNCVRGSDETWRSCCKNMQWINIGGSSQITKQTQTMLADFYLFKSSYTVGQTNTVTLFPALCVCVQKHTNAPYVTCVCSCEDIMQSRTSVSNNQNCCGRTIWYRESLWGLNCRMAN